MSDRAFILDLAKLVIATAWADRRMANEEVNTLKDLIFSLPEVSGADWQRLEIYLDSPVGNQERDRLLSSVLNGIKTDDDKQMVMATLRKLIECDGVVTAEETRVLEEIKQAVDEKNTRWLGRLSSLIGSAVNRREGKLREGPNREARLDDYIRNTVYFQIVSELEAQGRRLSIAEDRVRRLCLAAGLMARVAWVDEDISDTERAAIRRTLQSHAGLTADEACLVCDIAATRSMKGLDFHRLTRSFYECSGYDERKAFLDVLFQVANAAQKTTHDEIEEIRRIADALKLSHKDFIRSKLTISSEDRGGL